MDVTQIIAIAVFALCMTAIMTEKLHRTVAAIVGAMAVLILKVMSFDQAISHIDFNTLGVLFGMMLFVSVVKESGAFEYLAVKTARFAKGDPWRIMLLFILLTALLSALLDNVTTVLLIGPVTLTICRLLDVNPVPYFMAEIMASNIGGTATLIGDPPNIMIGNKAGLSFLDFVCYDTPVVLVILAVLVAAFYFLHGRKLRTTEENRARIMKLDDRVQIRDPKLLRISAVMTVLVVLGFCLHGALGIESCVVAITAGGVIVILAGANIEKCLAGVEWTTLGFFIGLFIVVGALSETGVIEMLAQWLVNVTGGNVFVTMIVLLFGSAIISSFLDNIPFVATMIPILLALQSSGMDVAPLWWALSLGACLGGNGTLIGASANVVLADISKKHGYEITFAEFLKTGMPIMAMSVAIAALYLIVRFPPL